MADEQFPFPTIAQVLDVNEINKANGLTADGKDSAVFVDIYEKNSVYLKTGGNVIVHWCYGTGPDEDVALTPPQYADTTLVNLKFPVPLTLLIKSAGKSVYVYYKYAAPSTSTMTTYHKTDAKPFPVNADLGAPVALAAPKFSDSFDGTTLPSNKSPINILVPPNALLALGKTVAVTLTGYSKTAAALTPPAYQSDVKSVTAAGASMPFSIPVPAWIAEDVGSIKALYAINTDDYISPTATVTIGGTTPPVDGGVYNIKAAGAGDWLQRGDDTLSGAAQLPWIGVGTNKKWKSLAIDDKDQLYGWGLNDYGQTGMGQVGGTVRAPSLCVFEGGHPNKIVNASTAFYHALAVDDTGQMWATGGTEGARGGLPGTEVLYSFKKVGLVKFAQVSAGAAWQEGYLSRCGLGISTDGRLYEWGTSVTGVLSQNGVAITTPTAVASVASLKWKSVTHYVEAAAGITDDGDLYMWGTNFADRDNLADAGGSQGKTVIVGISNGKVNVLDETGTPVKWKKVELGVFHVLAIDTKNRLWGWGQNIYRSLAGVPDASRAAPYRLLPGTEVTDISANFAQSVALTKQGHVYTWGSNDYYAIGHVAWGIVTTPTILSSVSEAVGAVVTGYRSIFLLTTDHTL